jgi:pyrroline-5-carboxylate reductase
MSKISFIGAGRMAEAILKELLRVGWVDAGEVTVSDTDGARLEMITTTYGVNAAASNQEAAGASEVIILAVKPQTLEKVLREIAAQVGAGQTVISIAMGKTTAFIEELLQEGTAVMRVMPNNPAMIGEAVSVISCGRHAGADARGKAEEIFSCLGKVYELDEKLQDEAMAISGCGPAYFYVFADALCDAGVKLGLDRDMALKLVTGTMIGAGLMLRETGQQPSQLKDMVTSPGGSTIAALEALEEAGLRNAIFKAVTAASRRAKEV